MLSTKIKIILDGKDDISDKSFKIKFGHAFVFYLDDIKLKLTDKQVYGGTK